MKTMLRLTLYTLVAALMSGLIFGCEKPAGPAEQAGKAVDKAMDKVGQQVEKAADAVQDATKAEKK